MQRKVIARLASIRDWQALHPLTIETLYEMADKHSDRYVAHLEAGEVAAAQDESRLNGSIRELADSLYYSQG